MDETLFAALVCPRCKSALRWRAATLELVCREERLAFRVVEGVPVLLVDEARALTANEETA